MATERNLIALKNALNYYKHAFNYNKRLYELLTEYGKVSGDAKYAVLDNIELNFKELSKFTNKISITIIENAGYDQATVDRTKEKLEEFKNTILYTERFLLSKKLLYSSIYNIEILVEKSQFNSYDYFRYAKDEKELAKKIALILADPRRVVKYKAVLSKISNGKMELEEFKKLYDSIKGLLPIAKQNESFISYRNFKKII